MKLGGLQSENFHCVRMVLISLGIHLECDFMDLIVCSVEAGAAFSSAAAISDCDFAASWVIIPHAAMCDDMIFLFSCEFYFFLPFCSILCHLLGLGHRAAGSSCMRISLATCGRGTSQFRPDLQVPQWAPWRALHESNTCRDFP